MSLAEHIEKAINGTYVNQFGCRVDNGIDSFDYIIAIPYYYDAESAVTIAQLRPGHLGNYHALACNEYERDERNADGEDYSPDDLDYEFSFVQVYDATGWPNRPAARCTKAVLNGRQR